MRKPVEDASGCLDAFNEHPEPYRDIFLPHDTGTPRLFFH